MRSKYSFCIAQFNKESLKYSSESHFNMLLHRSISTLSFIFLITHVQLNTWNVSFSFSIPQCLHIADVQRPCWWSLCSVAAKLLNILLNHSLRYLGHRFTAFLLNLQPIWVKINFFLASCAASPLLVLLSCAVSHLLCYSLFVVGILSR